MRWRDREWESGWRFALWPMLVGHEWMWLEWYWMERKVIAPDEADDDAAIASASKPDVSATTQQLIDLLIERDQLGRAKYGATLDRTDLTPDQWLQHMVEELLDGAGYALAAKRTEEIK